SLFNSMDFGILGYGLYLFGIGSKVKILRSDGSTQKAEVCGIDWQEGMIDVRWIVNNSKTYGKKLTLEHLLLLNPHFISRNRHLVS
ncbi:Kinesin-like protein KIF2A, partial [Orchesella cincta]